MSFNEEEFEKFADEQVKIFRDASAKIKKNAIDFHRASCEEFNDTFECERAFLRAFSHYVAHKLMEDKQGVIKNISIFNPN